MIFSLGLTGSIGMGKSTTAKMFAAAGCDVWDADAAVHRLYAKGGAAVDAMEARFPGVVKDGQVSRVALKDLISNDPNVLHDIESIVHPLVAHDRAEFRKTAASDILVFDIPLLFETGGDGDMDAVACVTIDAKSQQQRVLDRETMTFEQFEQILHKQMPIAKKTTLSDYVIVTDTVDHARQQVGEILADIRKKMANA